MFKRNFVIMVNKSNGLFYYQGKAGKRVKFHEDIKKGKLFSFDRAIKMQQLLEANSLNQIEVLKRSEA